MQPAANPRKNLSPVTSMEKWAICEGRKNVKLVTSVVKRVSRQKTCHLAVNETICLRLLATEPLMISGFYLFCER